MLITGCRMAFADVAPALPSWDPQDRKQMIDDGWIAGGFILTDESAPPDDSVPEAALHLDDPSDEELAFTLEDGNEVSGEYVADYFSKRPDGHLVDPQNLLSESERNHLGEFLNSHSADSAIDLNVYVFGSDQQIPGDVRDEELAERLYSEGKPAMVIFYYLGSPKRSAMYLSPVMTDTVSAAEQRRALESSELQALGTTKPFNQVEAFLEQMSIRIYWMERMADGTAEGTMENIPDGERARAFHKSRNRVEEPVKIPSWIITAAWFFAAGSGGVIALWCLVIWWRGRVRYRFPEFGVEPRLGGNHGAGVGAVISFASPAVPPAMQRNQVPDYMRRA